MVASPVDGKDDPVMPHPLLPGRLGVSVKLSGYACGKVPQLP